TNPNELAEPVLEKNHYFGPNEPTLLINPSLMVTYRGVQLSFRGAYSGGNFVLDMTSARQELSAQVWPFCDKTRAMIKAEGRAQVPARWRALCNAAGLNADGKPATLASPEFFIWPGDFFKLREIQLSLPTGKLLPGSSSGAISLTARNLFRWKTA